MILSVCSIKGGVGKSTIALNLAVLNISRRVLLIDADRQESLSDMAAVRTERGDSGLVCVSLYDRAVLSEAPKLAVNYGLTIIDCGGRDNAGLRAALVISDLCLIPFLPRSIDLWTLDTIAGLIAEAGNPKITAFSMLNKADTAGRDNDEARAILESCEAIRYIDAPIRSRKSIANSAGTGRAVSEYQPIDRKAISEFEILNRHLFDTIKKPL